MNTYSFRKDLLAVQEELLRFAYKLTADREEANDLLQETSLKALDNEDKFEPDTNFRGWMYTIMRNIFINNYRKIVREQTCGPDGQSVSPQHAPGLWFCQYRGCLRPERNASHRQCPSTRL